MADSISIRLDGLPHGQGTSDKVGNLAARIADAEAVMIARKAEQLELMQSVVALVDRVEDDRHARILHARYIELLKWEEIAVNMGISFQWVCVLHGRALEDVASMLCEDDVKKIVSKYGPLDGN